MKEIIFGNDKYQMNWLRQDYEYAKVTCPKSLASSVNNSQEGNLIKSEILLKNISDKTVFTSLMDIGITFPLVDNYECSDVCITSRCHTHIFCGEDISYICALRMGGESPHLGMLLMEGSLGGYSMDRNIAKMSNDRGCFILHPSPMELLPDEETRICFRIFAHNGKEDFAEKIRSMRKFVTVSALRYVIFPDETCHIMINPSFQASSVQVDGQEIAKENGSYKVKYSGAKHLSERNSFVCRGDRREKKFHICVDGIHTTCRILVQDELEALAHKRCHFISDYHQYHGRDEHLKGGYLIYDNEENHIYYNSKNDYNGGRERVGMGLVIAKYLQTYKDSHLEQSLQMYTEYVIRELVDVQTGEVYNDYKQDKSHERLYNWPWFATFFVELYQLSGQTEYLTYACRIVRGYYQNDGENHYCIEMPILALKQALMQAAMTEEQKEMENLFRKHADNIAEIGYHYPPFEVNFEQSIVAPATNILLQVYLLTREEKYLEAGKKQLEVLELFNGSQPDYHLHETAIRHWDGYWFGKRKLYGDTYPHYWSGLTGNCFELYYRITGDENYARKAENSLRSVLSLIFPDGTASCAYVFPASVNGVRSDMYDPYANDQDWALYFYLRKKQEQRNQKTI